MIIVDVETTGTNGRRHSILSIGAVELENPVRQFYGECRIWDGAHVMDEALAVNGFTSDQIADPAKKSEAELIKEFLSWYEEGNELTFVGMNLMLDYEFIREAADRANADFKIAKRTLDIHTICYTHLIKRGLEPPVDKKHSAINSDFISEYVGIPPEPRPHIALNGALWEAEQVSRLLYGKKFLKQFTGNEIPWSAD